MSIETINDIFADQSRSIKLLNNTTVDFSFICHDCVRIIISNCDLFSLLCLQLTSNQLRSLSRKTYKRKMFRFDAAIYQLRIANSAAKYGVQSLEWLLTLNNAWTLPNYCHSVNIETLEWIKRRTLERVTNCDVIFILNKNCPTREILNWMLDNDIEEFSLEQVAMMGYYDILERSYIRPNLRSRFAPDYPDYNILCWEIDNGKKLAYYHSSIIPCLVGGGKRYIAAATSSTDGGADISNFVCTNTGIKKLDWAVKTGYQIEDDAFISAVEANNIEALDYLKSHKEVHNAEQLLDVAIKENNYDAVYWIVENCLISLQRQLLCSNIEILLYLQNKGFMWDASTYTVAIMNEDLETIKYLHNNKVPWVEDEKLIRWGTGSNMNHSICSYLAISGNIEIMKWCLINGLSFDYSCCNYASDLEMIKYLISLGLNPSSSTLECSMCNIKTFKWLICNGVKPELDHLIRCHCYGSNDVKRWLDKHKEIFGILEISPV